MTDGQCNDLQGNDSDIDDLEFIRQRLRTVLIDVNELVASISAGGLPNGTHGLATALRQRLDDLAGAIDTVLVPPSGTTRRTAPAAGEPAAVDEVALNALLADLDDQARVSHLVQLFLNELHDRRAALMNAVESVDVTAAKAAAHTLRSTATLLGAAPLRKACEVLATNEQPAQLRHLVEDVLYHATAAARWFQIWLSNQPVAP